MGVDISDSVQGVLIDSELVKLRSRFAVRVRQGDEVFDLGGFEISERNEAASTLPGIGKGKLLRDIFKREGWEVTREVFLPNATCSLAVRITAKHFLDEPQSFEALLPIVVEDQKDFMIESQPAGRWVIFRQPRHKNDLPAVGRLGGTDTDTRDAQVDMSEDGGFPKRSKVPLRPYFISSELTVLRGRDGKGDGYLLVGYVPQDRQLVRTYVEMSSSREKLVRFEAECQCDGAIREKDEEFESQWVWLDWGSDGRDPNDAINRYVDILLASSQATGKRCCSRMSVWCSWYYYGETFTYDDLKENLKVLKAKPLPIDVVQIDECWDVRWGEWEANPRWPRDMSKPAKMIRDMGYEPGIWTAPFLAENRSYMVQIHPDWLLRRRDGNLVIFTMGIQSPVLDPTHPEVEKWIEDLYHRLTQEWGYTYHKLDFTRAVGYDPEAVFYDKTATRAEAYHRGMEAVRRGIGPDSYLLVCGGLYGPCLGLADGQRSGSDVVSQWPEPYLDEGGPFGPFTIKQNILRFWMNRLWDNDPDALMVRRRTEPFRHCHLSLGNLTDTEAGTLALNQYLGGGIICFTENLTEIDDDRLNLLRHCVPSPGSAGIPRDVFDAEKRFPSVLDTEIVPTAEGLEPWHTVSVINFYPEAKVFDLKIDKCLLGDFASSGEFIVSEFWNGKIMEKMKSGDSVTINVPSHGCEVVRIARANRKKSQILWTNGHFSMGGREVISWEEDGTGLALSILWPWREPLEMLIKSPEGKTFSGQTEGVSLEEDGRRARIRIKWALDNPIHIGIGIS